MSLPLIGPNPDDRLHVMTFNIRNDGDTGTRAWSQRLPRIARLLTAEGPAVLGVQEARFRQVRELGAALPGHQVVALGRDGGSEDEATAVFYDADRLVPTAFAHRWLSDTPLLMASTTWDNDIPRMLTWVRFLDRRTGTEFVFVNTHFDHRGPGSRLQSARQVRDLVAGMDCPVVVAGDFNVDADSPVHRELCAAGLRDMWDIAADRLTPAWSTFQDWEPRPSIGDRIDWLLTTAPDGVEAIGVNTWTDGEHTPSDHWPLQAVLRLG